MNYEQFIEYYYPKVSSWNKLANAPFKPKNEFKMLAEEYLEYKIAVQEDDLPEIVDAIVDQLFIILGTAYKIGYTEDGLLTLGWSVGKISVIKKIKDGSYLNEDGTINDNIRAEFSEYVYLLYGKLQEYCNYNDDCIKEVLDAVYDANLSKIESEGGFTFTKTDGGKVEKPKDFTPPDIKEILTKYGVHKEPLSF